MNSLKLTILVALLLAFPVLGQEVDAGAPPAAAIAVVDAGVPALSVAVPAQIDPENDPLGTLEEIGDAVEKKSWGKLMFIFVTLGVWAARKYLSERFPVIKGDVGGVAATFLLSFAAMLATNWGPHRTPDLNDVLNALVMALAASGAWTWFKKLVLDKKDEPAPAPPPAQPPVA